MLDSETKRRIDTARDILVGKVPDPKSQVEQITIALIYKFMDDMDKQSVELGGKASFFKGGFEKYSWTNIFDPRLGGIEMLALYGDAITRMSQNANLPELFRNIFKNAYLPYHDPETLTMFLKVINDFNYDHSEKLGDAFEYLLSVLGSQGDAGQFRTPRHIIDFMVKVVDPKKTETVLDPACGTAGFLIAAYKHILQSNQASGKPLTTQEKQRLYDNFTGYDISPDMVRLSLVNLYLHGFVKPQIHEYDTLTSLERWNDYADVILANPPFMSPKGGIQPHKRFSVQSNRSEVLFVDYMAEHLTTNGRAAIIVPEGIIFQSAGAYKQLRKYLIESNYLWAVVSLPSGMFNPYAGVKTSILFLDKSFAKKTDKILFVKIEKDGYDLGAQRRPLCNEMGDKPELCPKHSDLPDVLNTLNSWCAAILDGKSDTYTPISASALLVSTSKLAENEYNLSADRYREVIRLGKQKWPMVALGDERYFSIESGGTPDSKNEKYWNGDVDWATLVDLPAGEHISIITDTQRKISQDGLKNSSARIVPSDSIIVSSRATIGRVGINKIPLATNQGFKNIVIKDRNSTDTMFVALMSKRLSPEMEALASGGTFKEISKTSFSSLKIPLPPLEIQRQIVDEIAAHQRIIDGARQVVDGWKPEIEIDTSWEILQLNQIAEVTSSKRIFQSDYVASGVPFYRTKEVVELSEGEPISLELFISKEKYEEIEAKFDVPKKGEILISAVGTIGISWVISDDRKFYFKDGNLLWIKNLKGVDPYYLKTVLDATLKYNLHKMIFGAAYKALTIVNLKKLEIPLPSLEIQRAIVARIERERLIVAGNRELIRLYEQKVKKVIERVWEG
jgi:type I restriction enzyme M protein